MTPEDRKRILQTYYDPHHAALTQAVDDALAEAGACLIIDVHSFPSKPLPYELDQSPDRPEFCIGFDDFHGAFLADGSWNDACRCAGLQGAANRPFPGSIVPTKHWKRSSNALSAMIEVRRDLYMDEETGRKLDRFDNVKLLLADLFRRLGKASDRGGRTGASLGASLSATRAARLGERGRWGVSSDREGVGA
ncbi:MAG: hypothetical protein KatS3mg116_3692 [Elioraea sp.]|nr:MAG: hypothetical protein KatS3mg116_3692 [Elioraea sp.]